MDMVRKDEKNRISKLPNLEFGGSVEQQVSDVPVVQAESPSQSATRVPYMGFITENERVKIPQVLPSPMTYEKWIEMGCTNYIKLQSKYLDLLKMHVCSCPIVKPPY